MAGAQSSGDGDVTSCQCSPLDGACLNASSLSAFIRPSSQSLSFLPVLWAAQYDWSLTCWSQRWLRAYATLADGPAAWPMALESFR